MHKHTMDVVQQQQTGVWLFLSLCRRFQHFEKEGFNGCISNEFKKEEVLEAFETDGA